METRNILVRGARVHNLKNVDTELPRNQLICFTGVSGSGKSSMAFDTLYAEGQRRYVASLSAYARQFLGQMEKPDVDQISGLSPTISISQKSGGANPRSTVGTITEIYDYLRVLFARCGTPHCVECGSEIGAQSRDEIVSRIASLPMGSRIHVLAPLVQERKGEYHELFEQLQKDGFLRVRVDDQVVTIEEAPELDRYSRHNIDVVIDRLVIDDDLGTRLNEAVDGALKLGNGTLVIAVEDGEDRLLSANYDCPSCGISYQEPTPQMFSFNNPQGMCPGCDGLGTKIVMSEDLMIPDAGKSILDGAVQPLGDVTSNRWRLHLYEGIADHLGFTLSAPWSSLSRAQTASSTDSAMRGSSFATQTRAATAGPMTIVTRALYPTLKSALPQRQQQGPSRTRRVCQIRSLPHLPGRPPQAAGPRRAHRRTQSAGNRHPADRADA